MRTAAERRYIARKAARASARSRRAVADPLRRRAQQRELALNFRVRLVDREEFDRRDTARRLRAGLAPNERGTETLWQEYCSCARTFHAKGQGFLTTNGQRAAALRQAGRPRCERTIRRAHAALAQMGLLRRFHDRRGGWRAGNKDRLRVHFAPSFVPPPSAAPAASLRDSAAGAHGPAARRQECASGARREDRPASPARAAPPDGGRWHQPALRPANDSDEREGPNVGGGDAKPAEPVRPEWEERARAARARLSVLLDSRRGDRR